MTLAKAWHAFCFQSKALKSKDKLYEGLES